MSKKIKAPKPRRVREHKTNYYRRLTLLKGRRPRLVVRIFSRTLLGQLVEYSPKGDKVMVSFNSIKLKEHGWSHNCRSLPAAYLTGYALAKKGLAAGVKEAVLDLGFHQVIKGSRIFSFVKGAVDGGLEVPVSEEMFPAEERLKGGHIDSYIGSSKSKPQFSKTNKGVAEEFAKVKAKIK